LCLGCHQAVGQGVSGVYPPLAQSEWVTGDAQDLARIVVHGLHGRVVVRGQTYQQTMPAWRALGAQRLAAVLTYVRSAWGNAAEEVSVEQVQRIVEEGTRAPLTIEELSGQRSSED